MGLKNFGEIQNAFKEIILLLIQDSFHARLRKGFRRARQRRKDCKEATLMFSPDEFTWSLNYLVT